MTANVQILLNSKQLKKSSLNITTFSIILIHFYLFPFKAIFHTDSSLPLFIYLFIHSFIYYYKVRSD